MRLCQRGNPLYLSEKTTPLYPPLAGGTRVPVYLPPLHKGRIGLLLALFRVFSPETFLLFPCLALNVDKDIRVPGIRLYRHELGISP